MQSNQFELFVEVDGRPVKEFGNHGKTYVEGRKGKNFSVKFRNNTAAQVLAVFSIDGLSVMNGQPATSESIGYVVPGYNSLEVKGWRTSESDSCKFEFSNKKESYAGQLVGQLNCGVIGVMVYEEKVTWTVVQNHQYIWPIWPNPYEYAWPNPYEYVPWVPHFPVVYGSHWSATLPSNATFNTCAVTEGAPSSVSMGVFNSASVHDLGTAFGEKQEDKITYSSFTRGKILETLEIFYASAAGLKKAGIDITKKIAIESGPKAFSQFCIPPK